MPHAHSTDHLTCEVGPDHESVTLDDLPPEGTSRWVARRKAQVACAIEEGLLTFDEAERRYSLSYEEFIGWHRALYSQGLRGLKANRLKPRGGGGGGKLGG
jgi:hypothetical protein